MNTSRFFTLIFLLLLNTIYLHAQEQIIKLVNLSISECTTNCGVPTKIYNQSLNNGIYSMNFGRFQSCQNMDTAKVKFQRDTLKIKIYKKPEYEIAKDENGKVDTVEKVFPIPECDCFYKYVVKLSGFESIPKNIMINETFNDQEIGLVQLKYVSELLKINDSCKVKFPLNKPFFFTEEKFPEDDFKLYLNLHSNYKVYIEGVIVKKAKYSQEQITNAIEFAEHVTEIIRHRPEICQSHIVFNNNTLKSYKPRKKGGKNHVSIKFLITEKE